MLVNKEKKLKQEIIDIGKKLYDRRLVVSHAGNLSSHIEKNNILITETGSELGQLNYDNIIRVNLDNEQDLKNKRLTTEFLLHRLIYANFPHQAIIHCHPPLINAYFAIYPDIKVLTFEAKLYLGNVPVVEQDTPAVTQPELVIEALKSNNLVALKNHGVVAVGNNFKDALNLIETLEEAVKTAAVARLFKKEILDGLDKELKKALSEQDVYPMFSQQHIQAIVDLVNQDEFIARKGSEMDLTLQLAIRLEEENKSYKFNFERGKITKLEYDDSAPFVISAPQAVWELIFLGRLEPFVATTQGKMKLKGELGKLSRWYVPFSRLFELFKQVKIK